MPHTPGPWKVFAQGNQFGVVPVGKSGRPRGGRSAADVCGGSTLDEGWADNADLLAAAPDLLAALERLLHETEDGTGLCAREVVVAARAAVAKARGKGR